MDDTVIVEKLKKRVEEILPELTAILKLKCGLIDKLLSNGYVGGYFERRKYKKFARKINSQRPTKELAIGKKLWEELLKKRSLKKWALFFAALDKSGLSHVRRYIIGDRGDVTFSEYYDWPLSESQKQDFRSHRSAAVELLADYGNNNTRLYRKVMDMMVEHGTLTLKQRDAVLKEPLPTVLQNSLHHDAARRLLNIIPYKSIYDIQDFIHCLNELASQPVYILLWFDYL